jgi:RimJ/RimL family protein N-acetyltransferase
VARFFADVDHTDHEALVAIAHGTSDIVGVARYIRYRAIPLDADLAVTVSDSWQQVGLGSALLRLLAERARAEGVGRFTAEMLADNAGIIALILGAGGVVEQARGPVVRGHIDLAQHLDTPGCGRAEPAPVG